MTTSKRFSKNMENPTPASSPNTFLRPRDKAAAAGTRDKGQGVSKPLFFLSLIACLFFNGCVSNYTYPADKVPQSIESICKQDYNLQVSARVVGKTVGALFYVDELIDAKGQIPKEVHESIGKILQVVSRVALSTE